MSYFVFYRTKKISGKYKKIYKKGKSKKEYVKRKGKYILLIEYRKNLKENKKKGGATSLQKNLQTIKNLIEHKKYKKKIGGTGADSILNTQLKYDAAGNYIPSPECQLILANPQDYGLADGDIINTSPNAAERLYETRWGATGGKPKKKRKVILKLNI